MLPKIMSLQSPDQRDVGLKLSWPVIFFEPQWCDQHHCCQKTNVDFHTPLIPLHHPFLPWSSKKLWKMFKWTHGVSYSPTLEESHLSDAGLMIDNSQFVVLPRVCSSRVVVVHLPCLAHMTIQRGVPSAGAMRKSWFWWRTHEHPVHWLLMK